MGVWLGHAPICNIINERGVTAMCKAMEDMIAEARAEGRAEGKAEGRVVGRAEGSKENAISVARKMLKTERFSHEEIADFSGLTVDEVKELATKQPA